ncbi:hypothetical protein [Sporosarcina gallistercoris]|uniref:Uncharacterized protein n=1 Tax=Sporosarcina gallistercoris TaxID=2762245 RepID=A0ABR8PND0_9BACL|nr:hypothetical protein [Sporosarcina gallistercoris]MBD7909659.1 hypothetical protein [Sporosarcina gallistercoris]
METSMMFSILPILSLLFYVVPLVFIVWFVITFIRLQKEKNEILRTIADKLNKL